MLTRKSLDDVLQSDLAIRFACYVQTCRAGVHFICLYTKLLAIYTITRGYGIQGRTPVGGGRTSIKSLIHHTTTSNTHSLTLQRSQINHTHKLESVRTQRLYTIIQFLARFKNQFSAFFPLVPHSVEGATQNVFGELSGSVGIERDVGTHFVRVLHVWSYRVKVIFVQGQ